LHYQHRDKTIVIFARDENNRKQRIVVNGFEPYLLVPEDSELPSSPLIVRTEYGFKSIFGEPLVKVYVQDPSAVPKLRESFTKVYEADIPFVRRFLIDSNIFSGFEIPDGRYSIYWKDIKPVNVSFPLTFVVLDIEVETKRRFPQIENPSDPVVSMSLYDTISKKYVTVVLDTSDSREWWSPTHLVIRVTTEAQLFETVVSYLKRIEPDVLLGWNIFFDLDYFRARAKHLKLDVSIVDECAHLDLLVGYKRIFRKASNHLKDVALDEGIADEVIAEGYKLYHENRNLFIEYNMKDVLYPVKLNEKHKLLSYYQQFKTFVGLEKFSAAMQHSTKIDVIMLRDAHEHGEVLPTKPSYDYESEDDDSYEGAIVFEPKPGIQHDIGVFDMSRFYPSIMLAYHLSPERKDGQGIYERVIRRFTNLRLEYDKRLSEVLAESGPHSEAYESIKQQRQVVKDLLNAVYGYAGYKGSRLYDKNIAASVTRFARDALLFIKNRVENFGFGVEYGDTDSLLMKIPFEKCHEVEVSINEALRQYCVDQKIEPLLRIKFEKYYKTVVFTEHKGNNGEGAKKRYVARAIWDDGKDVDYTIIKGFERRDTSKVGMKIMKNIIEMILYDRIPEIKDYVSSEVKKIRDGVWKYDDIAMTSTLHQDLKSYKSKTPFVRGSIYANEFLGADIQGGDTVKLLPVSKIPGYPPTDYVCFLDESQLPKGIKVAVDELLRMSVQNKIESFLKVCGLNWLELSGQRTLLSAFE
jgi:DNA polymerase elongation subunit (family B)